MDDLFEFLEFTILNEEKFHKLPNRLKRKYSNILALAVVLTQKLRSIDDRAIGFCDQLLGSLRRAANGEVVVVSASFMAFFTNLANDPLTASATDRFKQKCTDFLASVRQQNFSFLNWPTAGAVVSAAGAVAAGILAAPLVCGICIVATILLACRGYVRGRAESDAINVLLTRAAELSEVSERLHESINHICGQSLGAMLTLNEDTMVNLKALYGRHRAYLLRTEESFAALNRLELTPWWQFW